MGTPAITVDELQGDQEHNADHGSGFIIDFGNALLHGRSGSVARDQQFVGLDSIHAPYHAFDGTLDGRSRVLGSWLG